MKGLFSSLGAKTGATKAPAAQPVAAGRGAGGDDLVRDGSDRGFMTEVMEVSRTVPVIVSFGSSRSAPCKQLDQLLEKLVRAAKGAVRLVKIDIELHKSIASQLRIQAIPAVYAFFQGRPVDVFDGAMTEAQLKTFVDRLVKAGGGAHDDSLEGALAEAKQALESGDTETASAIYGEILQLEPQHGEAFAGLVRCLIATGELKHARQMLEQGLPAELATDKAVAAARTALEVAEQSQAVGPTRELARKVEQNPADLQARFDLALAYFAEGQREAAVDALLEIVKRDREWNEQQARKQMVKFFEVFGPTDPLTVSSRRRLSSILFS